MKYKHFSIEEREIIQIGLWQKKSTRSIARKLGRYPSSISREIRRNFPPERRVYAPRLAHARALQQRKSRGRKDRLKNSAVRGYVISCLYRRWSPEQIAGTIKQEIGEIISHEAIYQFIYAYVREGKIRPGYEDLRFCLRQKKRRRTHHGMRTCQKITKTKGISIDRRPAIVDIRGRFGDWEGDSVESISHKPGINTLLERKSGYVMISKLRSKSAEGTNEAAAHRFLSLPDHLRNTLTLDQGPENTGWRRLEKETGIKCFFAHAYHAWERGANENVNGLIRDYFPKSTDFTMIPEAMLAFVERELNTRPRKRLGWRTPLEVMGVALQS